MICFIISYNKGVKHSLYLKQYRVHAISQYFYKFLEYKTNFKIDFNSTSKSWYVTVNSIPDSLTGSKNDLVLTLVATEAEKIGQAALVINFPILSTPEFSKDQYYGHYTLGDSPYLEIEDFSIVNKDNQNDIKLSFSSTDGGKLIESFGTKLTLTMYHFQIFLKTLM